MSVRRLADEAVQPQSFAFSRAMNGEVKRWLGKRWRNLFLQYAAMEPAAVATASQHGVLLDDSRPVPQRLAEVVKVADGKMARSRFLNKLVALTPDGRALVWDNGKKGVDLASVQRISVGLETKSLQKLYLSVKGAEIAAELPPYHWFSLHTASRSYDFGCKEEAGDASEALVLWVLTLQELLSHTRRTVAGGVHSLSRAQHQWQSHESPNKV